MTCAIYGKCLVVCMINERKGGGGLGGGAGMPQIPAGKLTPTTTPPKKKECKCPQSEWNKDQRVKEELLTVEVTHGRCASRDVLWRSRK